MIIFELGCAQGHHFEGWFASADDFTRQAAMEMVRCPVCDDEHIAIVPSAKVRVTKHAAAAPPVPTDAPEPRVGRRRHRRSRRNSCASSAK